MKVLIADDDPILTHLLDHTLTGMGHEIQVVNNGSAAIEVLLGADAPRMAILDWMMPGAEGPEVCREIRKQISKYVYIILLTGRGSRDDMVTALEAGADDFLTKPFDAMELRARVRSGGRVLELQESLLTAQESLRVLATRDDLTGFANRRVVLEQLEIELHRARHEKRPIAVAMADVDNFKRINDRYGHPAGDEVLRQIAARIMPEIRDYDVVGRYGGEEFLLVFPGCDATTATIAAERVRAKVAWEPVVWNGVELSITISLGIAFTEPPGLTSIELVQFADDALYRAKAMGRNRVSL